MPHELDSLLADHPECPDVNKRRDGNESRSSQREAKATRTSADDFDEPIEIVDDVHFDRAFDDAVDEPGRPDAFATLASLLDQVLRSMGGSDADASLLLGLLGITRVDASAMREAAVEALIAGEIVRRDEWGIARTDRFTREARGWQGILRAESDDFGPCGARALDEWASDLVARLLGTAARAPTIRRELRLLGIAAFGLVRRAA